MSLIVNDEKILQTLGIIAANVDRVRFVEVIDIPPMVGSTAECKITISLFGTQAALVANENQLRRYVSDDAFNAAIDELKVTREKRRQIQSFTQRELAVYIGRLYRMGFEDGANAVQQEVNEEINSIKGDDEEISVEWEDVLKVIGSVQGVSEKLLIDIDRKLKEAY